jgi:hypothetical protein
MRIEISIVLGAFGLAVLPYAGMLGVAAHAAETSGPCTIIETPREGAAHGGSAAGGLSSSVTVGGGTGSATTTLRGQAGQGSSVTVHSGGNGSAVAAGSASGNGTTVVTGSGGNCVITTPDTPEAANPN